MIGPKLYMGISGSRYQKAYPTLEVTMSHSLTTTMLTWYHNVVTGQSVTGSLQFMNKMPIDWYSKKQATVETATYGSKFIAA
jgi:hypothetical protein